MIFSRMHVGRAGLLMLAVLGLAGCDDGAAMPRHTPTPTPYFVSDAEALAAAKATYARFVDAVNRADPADPGTFEPVYETLTGTELTKTRRSLSEWHEQGQQNGRRGTLMGAELIEYEPLAGTVRAEICVDISDITMTSPTEPSGSGAMSLNVECYDVTFTPHQPPPGLRISSSRAFDG